MLAFWSFLSALGLLTALRKEDYANWLWFLVLAPPFVSLPTLVAFEQAYFTWNLGRELRDGRTILRLLALCLYSLCLPTEPAAELFILFIPTMVERTIGINVTLLTVASWLWLPSFFWRYGLQGLGQPLIWGLLFWCQHPIVPIATKWCRERVGG